MEPGHSTFSGPILWAQSFCPWDSPRPGVRQESRALQRGCCFPGQGEECPHPSFLLYTVQMQTFHPQVTSRKQASGNSPPAQIHSHMNTVFIPGRVTLSSGLLTHLINCNDHFIMLVRILLFSNVP